jgi:hypothetical protein
MFEYTHKLQMAEVCYEASLLLFLAALFALAFLFGEKLTHSVEPVPLALDKAGCVVHRHLLLELRSLIVLLLSVIALQLQTVLVIIGDVLAYLFSHVISLLNVLLDCGFGLLSFLALLVALSIPVLRQQGQMCLLSADMLLNCLCHQFFGLKLVLVSLDLLLHFELCLFV